MENTVVTLTVTDEHGATHQINRSLDIEIGPDVRNLRVVNDDRSNVRLSWSWTGDEAGFNILRNGVVVGSTNATEYVDQPPISGTVTYTVQPVDDERTFLGASDSISPVLDPIKADEPGPSTGLGFALGTFLILALVILPLLSQRGGERW